MLTYLGPRFRPRVFAAGVAVAPSPAEQRADQAAAGPLNEVAFDAELYPPAGSRALILSDQQNIAGAGTVAALPGLSTRLDPGFGAVIRQMQIMADSPTLTTRALWRILVDGVPVPGVGAVTMLWRAASSLALSFDTLRVRVPAGAQIDVSVTNVDGVPRVFGAQLVGWTFKVARRVGA